MIFSILLSGCSLITDQLSNKKGDPIEKEEEKKTKNETEKLEKEVKIPDKLKGLNVLVGPGPYSADQYDETKVKQEIDKLPKDLSAEEYHNKLLELVGEDYQPYIYFYNNFKTDTTGVDEQPEGMVKSTPGVSEGKEVNVAILFDASGSMAGEVSGERKVDLAKGAVNDFVGQLPEGVNVE